MTPIMLLRQLESKVKSVLANKEGTIEHLTSEVRRQARRYIRNILATLLMTGLQSGSRWLWHPILWLCQGR